MEPQPGPSQRHKPLCGFLVLGIGEYRATLPHLLARSVVSNLDLAGDTAEAEWSSHEESAARTRRKHLAQLLAARTA